jgi:VCBS repeat-containing protein
LSSVTIGAVPGSSGIAAIGGSSNATLTSSNVYSPNGVYFQIDSAFDSVQILSNTVACTGASVVTTGDGTSSITITITPFNYNGSLDAVSGQITVQTV